MNKIYTKLTHTVACQAYVKLKLFGKITLLQQTCNSVVPLSSHKLRERVFDSLSSCSFPLFGVRWSLPEPHNCIFGAPFDPAP